MSQKIKGYASINYRLSPYPSHPDQPSLPDDTSRNAKHPEHINDVSEAMIYLEKHYQISTGYLLVGHSCGATLVFQLQTSYNDTPIPAPLCIIGSEGIYNFAKLIETHESISAYREFITGAFGSLEDVWKEASPTTSTAKSAAWQQATLVVLSHSPDDELVDQVQADLMQDRIKRYWDEEKSGMPLYMPVPAAGAHDDLWLHGKGLAEVIEKSLMTLKREA